VCVICQPASAGNNGRKSRGTAPSITTQPLSQTVIAGGSAAFSVAVTGSTPLTYQWKKNGSAIYGANSSTYTTPAETIADNGTKFTVTVSNYAGRVTSTAATLTVITSPTVMQTTSNTTTGTTSTSGSTSSSTLDTSTSTSGSSTSSTGAASLAIAPLSLSFGNVTTGTTTSLPATLTNSGTAGASISNVSISGPGFSVGGLSTGQTLSPGQSVALTVIFAPTSSGSVAGSVTVASDAPNSPTTLGLSGSGVQPAPVVHSVALSWVPSNSSSVVGYNIYRSSVSGGSYTLVNSGSISQNNYVDSGLQSGTTYYYVATSVDLNNGESAFSSETVATIP
jgi:hypothetical protein